MAAHSPDLIDLRCSICLDLFKQPVVLECSHTFCKDCVETWWLEKAGRPASMRPRHIFMTWDKICPTCKQCIYDYRSGVSNLVVKGICHDVVSRRPTLEVSYVAQVVKGDPAKLLRCFGR